MRTFLILGTLAFGLSAVAAGQDKELRALGAALASQIKANGKSPVAMASFVNSNGASCSAFSMFIVDRLNILLVKGNGGFDVVTRDRVEEAFKEINLALGKYYDTSTFAKVGKHLGAKSLISGRYTVQASSAVVSLTAEIMDVETGRLIGGEVVELPYTGDIKAMLTCEAAGPDRQPEGAAPGTHEQLVQANDFLFRLKSCSAAPTRVTCKLTITSPEQDRWIEVGCGRSRARSSLFDQVGNESTHTSIVVGSQRDTNTLKTLLVRDVAIPSEISFDVKTDVRVVSLLQIIIVDAEAHKDLQVQFRNIRTMTALRTTLPNTPFKR